MAIKVLEEKCIGCLKCQEICPFDAITTKNKRAVIGDTCVNCGTCLNVCSTAAILQEDTKKNIGDLSQYKGVWIFAEQREGKIMPVVFELLGEGKKLAFEIGTELCAILCGSKVEDLVDELFAYGADKVYLADDPELANYSTDGYVKVISEVIKQYKPEIVICGATRIGCDLAPCLAIKLNTGLTANCIKFEIAPDDKKLRQITSSTNSSYLITAECPYSRPQMSTVQPGIFDKAGYDSSQKGEVIQVGVAFEKGDIRTKIIQIVRTKANCMSIKDAEVIVSGGLGLAKPEGFELLKRLADKLGGAVGSTKACVDAGWADHSQMIGMTGTTVKPTIYFACGISGASQHIAGMREAELIVAINTDEDAPIFEVADYGIIGDLYQVLPAIIDEINRINN